MSENIMEKTTEQLRKDITKTQEELAKTLGELTLQLTPSYQFNKAVENGKTRFAEFKQAVANKDPQACKTLAIAVAAGVGLVTLCVIKKLRKK